MKVVNLPRGDLDGDEYGSRRITMIQLANLVTGGQFRVHVAWCDADSVLGRHPTKMYQLFAVISGSGWVADSTGARLPMSAGQAVLWEPGEVHESGSECGMIVAMVQSPDPIVD